MGMIVRGVSDSKSDSKSAGKSDSECWRPSSILIVKLRRVMGKSKIYSKSS